MARHFDTIARLWDHIADFGIGFCLDTCHAHAAGEEMIGAAERILAITGRIDLVHCNDSKDGSGSGRDRHEHLGHGQVDPEALVEAVAVAKAPVICETGDDGRKDDIAWLRDRPTDSPSDRSVWSRTCAHAHVSDQNEGDRGAGSGRRGAVGLDPDELAVELGVEAARRPRVSWLPCSTIWPSSSTRIWSAARIVDSRWAITSDVRPASASASAACTSASFSRVEVAGGLVEDHDGTGPSAASGRWPAAASRHPTAGSPARPRRCRSPRGGAAMTSWIRAARHAASSSSSVASGRA